MVIDSNDNSEKMRSRPYLGKLHLLPSAEGMPFAGRTTEASILYTQQVEIAKRIFFKKGLRQEKK
jgi:hypothetical protein